MDDTLRQELLKALERLEELETKLTDKGNIIEVYDAVTEARNELKTISTFLVELPKFKGEKGDKGEPGISIKGDKGEPGVDAKPVDYSELEQRLQDLLKLVKQPTAEDIVEQYRKLPLGKKLKLSDISDYYQVSTASGGAKYFTELLDVPQTFVGAAGQAVIVNPTEDALIFSPGIPSPPIYAVTNTSTDLVLTDTVGDRLVRVDASSSPVTITLPSVVGNNAEFDVVKVDSSLNPVNVTSLDLINGQVTQSISFQYNSATFMNNTVTWSIH